MLHETLKDQKRNIWIRATSNITGVRKRSAWLEWKCIVHNQRQMSGRFERRRNGKP